MTVHDKIAAVIKPFVGMTLSTKRVRALVLEKYPDTNPTSIIPSDHSGPNPSSGRSYCFCSGKDSQIFRHDNGGYKVLDSAVRTELRSNVDTTNRGSHLRKARIAIDDEFIREWHPQYDSTESDEDEYQRLVFAVARDRASVGTISRETFLAIWKWKRAMRVIRHVRMEEYETVYALAFQHAASEPPEGKLAALLLPGIKLPGIDAATGSTIIHFIHPQTMPIMDVRTIGVLFEVGFISTSRKDLAHYEEFRRAIEDIRGSCPHWNLRQIDRALFAYHKQFLGMGVGGSVPLIR